MMEVTEGAGKIEALRASFSNVALVKHSERD